jgi:peroxiredoxin
MRSARGEPDDGEEKSEKIQHDFAPYDTLGEMKSTEFDIAPHPGNMCAQQFTHSMALKTDTQAPDFTLKTSDMSDFTLSSHFGNKPTLLLFFPLAFTGVCTQEFCDLTAGLQKYADLNANVVGISVDSPFAQDAWAKKEGIKITLVSDLNKEVTKAYDVLFPALAGIGDTSARAAFVIDKAGVIRYSEQTATPKDLPDFNKITEVLASL